MSILTEDEMGQFEKEYNKNKPPRATVLVCGWTGAGKSSLIKTMLDVNAPISDGTPCTQQFDVYENELIRVYDSKGMEKGEQVSGFVQKLDRFIGERRTTTDVESNIHIVWYAVDAVACRFDDGDAEIVKELFKLVGKKSLLFVLTKCDSARKNQIDGLIQKITTSCEVTEREIVPVCDEEGRHDERTKPEIKNGVRNLLEHTVFRLPDAVRMSMEMAQKVDIDRKLEIIQKKKNDAAFIVTGATVAAGGAAAIPIPIGTTFAITGIQISMVAGLAALYTVGIPKESVLPFIGAVAGRQAASSLLTLIPGLGSVINAGVAVIITGGIGTYCIAMFEKIAIAKVKNEKLPEIKFSVDEVLKYIKNYKKLP
jgi:uncharacterized protein (DUF697 family)/GTP-binding protein EngB required for normal cell division